MRMCMRLPVRNQSELKLEQEQTYYFIYLYNLPDAHCISPNDGLIFLCRFKTDIRTTSKFDL